MLNAEMAVRALRARLRLSSVEGAVCDQEEGGTRGPLFKGGGRCRLVRECRLQTAEWSFAWPATCKCGGVAAGTPPPKKQRGGNKKPKASQKGGDAKREKRMAAAKRKAPGGTTREIGRPRR